MGQKAWNWAAGEQSEMRSTRPGSIPWVQWVWLSALRVGHRTPDFALPALNKWVHPSGPAGSALSNAAQDATGLGHKSLLLFHAQFGVQLHSQVLFHQAAFPLGGLQHVLVPAFFPHEVQDLGLLTVELHEVPVVPFLQPTEVPLDGYTTLWHISHSFQFGVTGKPAKGTLCFIIPAVNEGVKQGWAQCVTPGVQSVVAALQPSSTPLTTSLWSQPLNQHSSQITAYPVLRTTASLWGS